MHQMLDLLENLEEGEESEYSNESRENQGIIWHSMDDLMDYLFRNFDEITIDEDEVLHKSSTDIPLFCQNEEEDEEYDPLYDENAMNNAE